MIAWPDVDEKANYFDKTLVLQVQKWPAHTKPETLEVKVRDTASRALSKTRKKSRDAKSASRPRSSCLETETEIRIFHPILRLRPRP